jgi:hypothetical protein
MYRAARAAPIDATQVLTAYLAGLPTVTSREDPGGGLP